MLFIFMSGANAIEMFAETALPLEAVGFGVDLAFEQPQAEVEQREGGIGSQLVGAETRSFTERLGAVKKN